MSHIIRTASFVLLLISCQAPESNAQYSEESPPSARLDVMAETAAVQKVDAEADVASRADVGVNGQSTGRPFGLWRMSENDYAQRVAHLTRPVTLTTQALNPDNAKAVLDRARAHGVRLIVSFEGRPQRRDRPFSLSLWKRKIDAFCRNDGSQTSCFDFDPYIADGTIIAARLFETNGEPDEGQRHAATLAQIKEASAYVKRRWPRLKTAIDGSRPCNLTPEHIRWTRDDLNVAIINIYSGPTRSDRSAEKLIDAGIRCAQQSGLEYMFNINPFGRARTQGLNKRGLDSFEHAMKYALTRPGSLGTIIWRWWPTSGREVSNGVKVFPNFWNESINPGVAGVMRRIEQCAITQRRADCS